MRKGFRCRAVSQLKRGLGVSAFCLLSSCAVVFNDPVSQKAQQQAQSNNGTLAIANASSQYDFGTKNVGASASATFTITNSSGQSATLGTVSTAGIGLASPFTLSGGTCATDQVIPAGGSCTLVVAYGPTTTSPSTATIKLDFTYPDPSQNGTVSLPLRGNGQFPSVLTGSASFWVKADSLAATYSDGQSVSSWSDQSASALNLSASGTARPTFHASGAGANSLPYVHFSDSAAMQCMESAGNSGSYGDFTAIALFRPIALGTTYETILGPAWDVSFALTYDNNGPSWISQLWALGTGVDATGFSVSSGTWYILGSSRSGTAGIARWNGTAVTNTAVPSTATTTYPMSVGCQSASGGDQIHNGDVAEGIVFSSALSATDLQSVECYLSAKYGVAVSETCQ